MKLFNESDRLKLYEKEYKAGIKGIDTLYKHISYLDFLNILDRILNLNNRLRVQLRNLLDSELKKVRADSCVIDIANTLKRACTLKLRYLALLYTFTVFRNDYSLHQA